MKYPTYLTTKLTFMTLPKSYQEYFVWHYYTFFGERSIPDTIPVEHIEDHIVKYLCSADLWMAKGFESARNVENGNAQFMDMEDFKKVLIYVAKLWYIDAIQRGAIRENISLIYFKKVCRFFQSAPAPDFIRNGKY